MGLRISRTCLAYFISPFKQQVLFYAKTDALLDASGLQKNRTTGSRGWRSQQHLVLGCSLLMTSQEVHFQKPLVEVLTLKTRW